VPYNPQIETHSLYLHWPFCPYRCTFCPFVALASHDQFMLRYKEALCKEILQFASVSGHKQKINTVFIGGGTPSTCPDEQILDISGKLRSVFIFNEDAEFTIEVNPGTVTESQLYLWKELGINRLSIGVQSLNDFVLKNLGRLQSSKDVFNLLNCAQKVFDNISVDLILGLPGVLESEWKKLLKTIVCWPIKHISIYFLTVHKDTKLYYRIKSKKIVLPNEDKLVDLYRWSVEFLSQKGFKQYEISNFAKPGYESKHNETYWERKSYKGFGLGACSFDGTKRFQNHKNLMIYLQGVERGENIEILEEELTEEQIRLEKLMLGLRRSKGIKCSELFDGLSQSKKHRVEKNLELLKVKKLIFQKDENLFLTLSGLAVENEIVVMLSV